MRFVKIVFLFFYFTCCTLLSEDVLKVVSVENFYPYSWQENGDAKGIDIDITRELFVRLGVKYELSFIPWKRILLGIKSGNYDCGLSAFKIENRLEFSYYNNVPLHKEEYRIFVKKGNEFEFEKIDDLYNKKVGQNLGFHIDDLLINSGELGTIDLIELNNMEDCFKKLNNNTIDTCVGEKYEGCYTIKILNYKDKITVLENPFGDDKNAYYFFSKKSKYKNIQELIKSIDIELVKMKYDGTIDKIVSKYIECE